MVEKTPQKLEVVSNFLGAVRLDEVFFVFILVSEDEVFLFTTTDYS